MSAFDLLFLAAVLITAITVVIILVAIVRGRGRTALRAITAWVIFAVLYVAASFAVSYLRPQRVIAIGEPWCFDDWCLKVNNVNVTPAASRDAYEVQFRIFSRAGRVTQRANGAWMYLIDDTGHLYRPEPTRSEAPLDVALRPRESVATTRLFEVPKNVRAIGVITGHGGPYCGTMSVLVIGDGGCWFHKPPMIRIQ